ncbi:hypothetical protein FB480_101888 [Agrobacterium vitis]|nr:hypothetical protein FB480_101888 [Agrobacterium vitis]
MSPQETDALIRENHRLRMIIMRAFRELDPSSAIDTHSDTASLGTLPFIVRAQLRLCGREAAQ